MCRALLDERDGYIEILRKAEGCIANLNSFYGEGMSVLGWHLNGQSEPFDTFLVDSEAGDTLETIRALLLPDAQKEEGRFEKRNRGKFRPRRDGRKID